MGLNLWNFFEEIFQKNKVFSTFLSDFFKFFAQKGKNLRKKPSPFTHFFFFAAIWRPIYVSKSKKKKFSKWTGLKFGEFLKKEKKLLEKSAAKSSEKISEIWENWEKKWVNGLGFFCLFSADLWKFERKKLKNWKNYRSDAISEEKEGEKQWN